MGLCYIHMGTCNFILESDGEQVYWGPQTSSTQHASARQNKLHSQDRHPHDPIAKQAHITSQPVCAHSQSKGSSVAMDVKEEPSAWLLIWAYLFSSTNHTLSYNLKPNSHHLLDPKPFQRIRPIHLLYTDGWMTATDTQPLISRGENSHVENKVGLWAPVHTVVTLAMGFTVCLVRRRFIYSCSVKKTELQFIAT